MTEAKWTPGPWVLSSYDGEPLQGVDGDFEVCSREWGTVAFVPYSHLANARLIASAPALVEALAWFVDREAPIQAKFNLHGPEDTAAAMRDAFRRARSALGNAND